MQPIAMDSFSKTFRASQYYTKADDISSLLLTILDRPSITTSDDGHGAIMPQDHRMDHRMDHGVASGLFEGYNYLVIIGGGGRRSNIGGVYGLEEVLMRRGR